LISRDDTYLPYLDWLRGALALTVVLGHAQIIVW
jgi:peptidoglycan/LPS O-acetylase OafA/YrhL